MTLTEFLLARIAEDEASAKNSTCQCGGQVCTTCLGWFRRDELEERFAGTANQSGAIDFMLTQTPARVLTDCEAKRAIIGDQLLYPFLHARTAGPLPSIAGLRILKALALPYADHPDYQQEWRP